MRNAQLSKEQDAWFEAHCLKHGFGSQTKLDKLKNEILALHDADWGFEPEIVHVKRKNPANALLEAITDYPVAVMGLPERLEGADAGEILRFYRTR
jgi:hypothetical protein